MSSELKRCPFCGGNVKPAEATVTEITIRCECGAKLIRPNQNNFEEVVEHWQNRPIETDLLEALEETQQCLIDIFDGKGGWDVEGVIRDSGIAISKAKGEQP